MTYLVSAEPLKSDNGNRIGVETASTDITPLDVKDEDKRTNKK